MPSPFFDAASFGLRLKEFKQRGEIAKGQLDVERNRNAIARRRNEALYGKEGTMGEGLAYEDIKIRNRALDIQTPVQDEDFNRNVYLPFKDLVQKRGIDKGLAPIFDFMDSIVDNPEFTKGRTYKFLKDNWSAFRMSILKTLEREYSTAKDKDPGKAVAILGMINQIEADQDGEIIDKMMPRTSEAVMTGRILLASKQKEPKLYETTEGYLPASQAIGLRKPYPEEKKQALSFKDVVDLQKKFNEIPEVKEYVKITTQMSRAAKAIEEARTGTGSLNAVDQSLITLLNKILDPTSVVRESEYARTPEGMALLERAKGWAGKLKKGGAGLSPKERESIYNMIDKFYEVSEQMYNDQVAYYTELANKKGVDPTEVIRLGGQRADLNLGAKYKIGDIYEDAQGRKARYVGGEKQWEIISE